MSKTKNEKEDSEKTDVILPEQAELDAVKRIGEWMDTIHNNITTLVYACCPKELWDRKGGDVELELVGAEDREELPDGLYLTDIPSGLEEEYKTPMALAVAHIGRRPSEGIKYMPYFVNMVFSPPSATERAAARGEVRKWSESEDADEDTKEWCEEILRLGKEGKLTEE